VALEVKMSARSLVAPVLVALLLSLAAPARAAFLFVPRWPQQNTVTLESEQVKASIENGVAFTRVTDVFRNHGSRPGEGDVVMPLPEGTVLLNMSIRIGGKEVKGEVLGRQEAAAVYEDIVRRMRDPLLAEWAGLNLMRVRLFPVPVGGTQEVAIEYATVVPVDHDLYRYTYPFKGCTAGKRLALDVDLKAGRDLRNVYSPTHEVEVSQDGARHATVALDSRQRVGDRDFVLYYSVSDDDVGFGLLPHRKGGQDGYFLMTFQPRLEKGERPPMHVVWVVDVSGSMAGEKLDQAKAALRYGINRLEERDSFNVILFSSDTDVLFKAPQPGTAENRRKALDLVNHAVAEGGTAIHDALTRAVRGLTRDGYDVVFLTDGQPTVGQTQVDRILSDVRKSLDGHARLFAFGVGDDVNTRLLDGLARDNSGAVTYVRPEEDLEIIVSHFFSKVAEPSLTDLELEVQGVEVDKLMPKRLPCLFRGEQMVVTGRYLGQGRATVVLKGRYGEAHKVFEFGADFPEVDRGNSFVPRLWATRRVAALLEDIRVNGQAQELVDEVTWLGKQFGIVTPYTAYLIKEEERELGRVAPPRRPNDDRPVQPAPGFWLQERRDARTKAAAPMGGDLGGGRGGGGHSGPAAQASPKVSVEAMADEGAFHSVSGKGSVGTSAALGALKKAEKMSDADASSVVTVQTVGERSFELRNGQWRDRAAEGSRETVRVKYLSPLYFALIARCADLREALSLGDQVRVGLKGFALEVGPDGQEEADEALLSRIQGAL
jgi:Ca-activated chloride channel family protein